MKKFLKGILLYATIIYFFCLIMAIESLSIIALIIGISLFILLLVVSLGMNTYLFNEI